MTKVRQAGSDLALLLLTFAIVAAARITAPSDLATGDQPLQTAYIDDIVVHGAWLVQHAPDGTIASKPPLYNWLAAGPMLIAGVRSESLYKLPSLLAALATLWFMYDLTVRIAGAQVARVAGLLLVTSPLFTKHLYFARTDMLVVLFIVMQIWAGFTLRPFVYWSAAAMAMLTKGPLGIVLPLAALSIWWWHRGELRERWRRMHVQTGLVLSVLPFLGWFSAALLTEGRPVWEELVRAETIDRFIPHSTKSKEHRHILYYVPHLLSRMAPASLFSLLAFPAIPWRRAARSEMLLPLLWVVSMLVLLSLVPSKRADRLLPLLPAISVLAGWAIVHQVRGITALMSALAIVAMVAGLALLFGVERWQIPAIPGAGIVVVAAGAAMLVPKEPVQIPALVILMIVATATYHFRLRPDLLEQASPAKEHQRSHARNCHQRDCPPESMRADGKVDVHAEYVGDDRDGEQQRGDDGEEVDVPVRRCGLSRGVETVDDRRNSQAWQQQDRCESGGDGDARRCHSGRPHAAVNAGRLESPNFTSSPQRFHPLSPRNRPLRLTLGAKVPHEPQPDPGGRRRARDGRAARCRAEPRGPSL